MEKKMPNCQLVQTPLTLKLRRFKKVEQEPSPREENVNKNVTACTSCEGMKTDNPVSMSCNMELKSLAKTHQTMETQTERQKTRSLTKRFELSRTQPVTIYCYTCESTVTGDEIYKHLFFGKLQCENCSSKIVTCKEFHAKYYSQDICEKNEKGSHIYTKWIRESLPYIQYYIHKDLIIKRFCDDSKTPLPVSDVNRAAAAYLRDLSLLESSSPWKLALSNCQYIMNLDENQWQKNSLPISSCSAGMTTFNPKQPNVVQSVDLCSDVAQRSNNEVITNNTKALIKFNKDLRLGQISESGQKQHASEMVMTSKKSDKVQCIQKKNLAGRKQWVVNYPSEKCPEKCPKCCCTLSVSTLTFNCSTFIMKIKCPECAFPIHIMLDSNTRLIFKKRIAADTSNV